jgi:hypothetical protein
MPSENGGGGTKYLGRSSDAAYTPDQGIFRSSTGKSVMKNSFALLSHLSTLMMIDTIFRPFLEFFSLNEFRTEVDINNTNE